MLERIILAKVMLIGLVASGVMGLGFGCYEIYHHSEVANQQDQAANKYQAQCDSIGGTMYSTDKYEMCIYNKDGKWLTYNP